MPSAVSIKYLYIPACMHAYVIDMQLEKGKMNFLLRKLKKKSVKEADTENAMQNNAPKLKKKVTRLP